MKKFLLRRVVIIGIAVVVLFSSVFAGIFFYVHHATSSTTTPTPSSANAFVTRSGSRLLLNGKLFRFAGPNIYWLGLDGNDGGVAYPTHFRVDDALATARDMGATVARVHTFGISVGCSLCVEPALGVFNDTALEHIDYAIKTAHKYGLKLIIPLCDNWRYYHGGIHTFTDWRGLPVTYSFYTDPTVIKDFEQYVEHLLNHVNTYTGIAYKDDPTIMAWETGNEISPTTTWTKKITEFIKGIDKHHLTIDGSNTLDTAALSLSSVDMFTAHYYPLSNGLFDTEAALVNSRHKAFFVGEYDWTGANGGDSLSSFLHDVEHSSASGDLYWALFAHNDKFGFEGKDTSYTVHFLSEDTDRQSRVWLLRSHAFRMQGKAVPKYSTPGTPLITDINSNEITWRGTSIATTYSVERSTTGANGPWTTVCNKCVNDNMTPWQDTSQPSGDVWYRVRAYNKQGVAGDFSPVFLFKPHQ